jgi:hypothetical protein
MRPVSSFAILRFSARATAFFPRGRHWPERGVYRMLSIFPLTWQNRWQKVLQNRKNTVTETP